MSTRGLIGDRTRTSVYHSFRQHQQILALRNRWPAVTGPTLGLWTPHVHQVRFLATGRVGGWFPSWLPTWRQAAPPPPDNTPPPQPVDPKRLPAAQLRIMLSQSSDYVVHRTKDPDVGMCKVPLRPEQDQDRMKNPMQEVAVFAAIGLTGLADYGKYGVVFRRTADWIVRDAPTVVYLGGELAPEQAVGWYHEDDLNEARQ